MKKRKEKGNKKRYRNVDGCMNASQTQNQYKTSFFSLSTEFIALLGKNFFFIQMNVHRVHTSMHRKLKERREKLLARYTKKPVALPRVWLHFSPFKFAINLLQHQIQNYKSKSPVRQPIHFSTEHTTISVHLDPSIDVSE